MYNQKPLLGTLINWAHPLSKGLVGAWLFNEGSGNKVFDLSGRGTHGILGGSVLPDWQNDGLYFYNDDRRVTIATSPTLDALDKITLILTAIVTEQANDETLLSFYYSSGDRFMLWYDDAVQGIRGYGKFNTLTYSVTSSFIPTVNVPFTIAFRIDGTTWKIYINGVEKATSNIDKTMDDMPNGFQTGIGFRIGDSYNDRFWRGIIKYSYIFNEPLESSQIAQLYYNPYCMFAPPMEAELMYAAPPVGVMSPYYYESLMAGVGI